MTYANYANCQSKAPRPAVRRWSSHGRRAGGRRPRLTTHKGRKGPPMPTGRHAGRQATVELGGAAVFISFGFQFVVGD